ncbi:MAG: DUF1566 domain-containing protein [Treponema sp.]|nr:DUF1566 domain-containing protein [Treponema sp.]
MKNKAGIIVLTAVIVITLSLTGCATDDSHTHNFGTAWKSNATQHWHECSCGEKSDTANHTFEAGECTVCEYEHTPHNFGTAWTSNATQHWHECSCGAKSELANHTLVNDICTVCGYHAHNFSTTWTSDATQHWHECSCGEKSDIANHTGNTERGLCSVCGALQYSLGDTGPGGGKIFYVSTAGFTMMDNSTTAHYLEAAPADMATTLAWASSAFIPSTFGGTGDWVDITGTETAIGTGRKNTALILATDADAPAAKACVEYSINEKTDWFLPSKDERNELYNRKADVGITSGDYWSSSEYSSDYAWAQNFSNGGGGGSVKSYTNLVRAVRAF